MNTATKWPREDGTFRGMTETSSPPWPIVGAFKGVTPTTPQQVTAWHTGPEEQMNTTAMDCEVGPKATKNQVQMVNREGGERQGVALEKGDGDPPAESKGT